MPSHHRTQTTRTTGHQHRATLTPRSGNSQHDLPHMLGLPQEPQRLRSPRNLPGRHRNRPQRTALEQLQQRPQHLPDPLRTRLHHIKRLIRDTRIRGGDLLRVADIGLAHLHEPATRPRQPQRRIHELPSQAIQYDMHPSALSRPREDLLELRRTGRSQTAGGDPELTHHGPLGLTRRREHLRTQMLSQLHRRHTHTTSSGMNQHRLARLKTSQIHQRVIRRQEHHRHRRRLLERPTTRHTRQHPRIRHRRRTKRPIQQTHHPVTHSEVRHPRADLQDHARAFQTHLARITRIHAQHIQHIAEVDPRRTHTNPHLTALQRPRLLRHQSHTIKPPLRRHLHAPRRIRAGRRHQHTSRSHPHQPGHPHRTPAHRKLTFTQSPGERPEGSLLTIDVGQYEPARMLTDRRTHQAPHPSTHQVRHLASTVLGRGHLHRTRRQYHQPRLREAPLGQPCADHGQHTGHRVGDLGVRGAERKHHGVRDGGTVIQRGGQRGQIGITGHRNTRVAPPAGPGITEDRPTGRLHRLLGPGRRRRNPLRPEQTLRRRGVHRRQVRGRHGA